MDYPNACSGEMHPPPTSRGVHLARFTHSFTSCKKECMQIIEGESRKRRKLIVIPATACALVFFVCFCLLCTYFLQFFICLFKLNMKWICDSILSRLKLNRIHIQYNELQMNSAFRKTTLINTHNILFNQKLRYNTGSTIDTII